MMRKKIMNLTDKHIRIIATLILSILIWLPLILYLIFLNKFLSSLLPFFISFLCTLCVLYRLTQEQR